MVEGEVWVVGAILELPSTDPRDLDRNPHKIHPGQKTQEGYVKNIDFDWPARES